MEEKNKEIKKLAWRFVESYFPSEFPDKEATDKARNELYPIIIDAFNWLKAHNPDFDKNKFKIGDIVRVIDTGDVASVKDLLYGTYRLDLDDVAGDIWYREEEIEAYDATKNNLLLAEFKGIVDGFASVQDKLRVVYSRLAKKAALVEKHFIEY